MLSPHSTSGSPLGFGKGSHLVNRTAFYGEDLVTGVYTMAELKRLGFETQTDIRRALRTGVLSRVSRGFYGTSLANEHVVLTLKVGGRIGCLTACNLYGLWTPPSTTTHVLISSGAATPTSDKIYHRVPQLPHTPVADLYVSLAAVCTHHDAETALIVLESALNKGLISLSDIDGLTRFAPKRHHATLRRAISKSQSGSETRVRNFLQCLGVTVEAQFYLPDVGYVDIRVDKSILIECDGAEFHNKPDTYEEDRRRDLAALAHGYVTIRLTYKQIWGRWEETKETLRAMIRTQRHRRPPRPA